MAVSATEIDCTDSNSIIAVEEGGEVLFVKADRDLDLGN
jgi:hypothetical protein